MNNLAPIILFVYNRPWHTQQTLEALAKNELANQSILYVYADGIKDGVSNKDDLQKITEVRKIISDFKGCKEVHIVTRDTNLGLAKNIIDGVTTIVDKYGKIIVLEDDIVTSSHFLKYMNDMLSLYSQEEKIMHISGYMILYPQPEKLPELFLVQLISSWGWGTWKRAWKHLEINTEKLLLSINTKDKIERFNIENTYDFYGQLVANHKGTLQTWGVIWYASFFIKQGYALFPNASFTENIGYDGSGENCIPTTKYQDNITAHTYNKIEILKPLEENKDARKVFADFYKPPLVQEKSVSYIKHSFFSLLPKKTQHWYRMKRDIEYKQKYDESVEYQRVQNLPFFSQDKTVILGSQVDFLEKEYIVWLNKYFLSNLEFLKKIYNHNNLTIVDLSANTGVLALILYKTFPQSNLFLHENSQIKKNMLEKNLNDLMKNDIGTNQIQQSESITKIVDLVSEKHVDILNVLLENNEDIKSIFPLFSKSSLVIIRYKLKVNDKQNLSFILNELEKNMLKYTIHNEESYVFNGIKAYTNLTIVAKQRII
jgi:GT2 family glycosyltransferase